MSCYPPARGIHGVVETMLELARAFPVPEERWHAHVPAMRRCLRDFRAALEALAADPAGEAALERALDTGAAAPADGPVAEALARLEELPAPEGEHPFVTEILPTLEAMRVALLAVAASPGAARRFATVPGPGPGTYADP
jgi:hypothetical protein